MLSRLTVRNLAVVSDVTLEFERGLTVVTGETGAGKSLLLGAVSLLLGARATPGLVRSGAERARVEGVFEPDDPEPLSRALEAVGLPELDDGQLLLRRDIGADGRSRAFVGDAQVRLSTMKDVVGALVDLHGQRDQHRLLVASAQRDALDAAAGTTALRHALAAKLEEERALTRELEEARARAARVEADRDYLTHQLTELEAAALDPDEEAALQRERTLMASASRIGELLSGALAELDEADGSASARLARATDHVEALADLDPAWRPQRDALEEARVLIEDVSAELRSRVDDLDFSPERRDEVEARLDTLTSLKRKHGGTIEALIRKRDELRASLSGAGEGGDPAETLDLARERVRADATRLAAELSRKRRARASRLAEAVRVELPDLGLTGARFDIELEAEADPEGWYRARGRGVRLDGGGAEAVRFRFSANPGHPLDALSSVASGGELSRVMLALKVALSGAAPAEVMILDEIDAGIGGETARAVATRLAVLARDRQVLAVTHLPAVAAAGTHHVRIEKRTRGRQTDVTVSPLTGSERVREIARMLSGEADGVRARRHAEEMLAGEKSKMRT